MITTQKQLLDTIESLEHRIERHSDTIHKLRELVNKYKDIGKSNKELANVAQYLESLIQETYK